MNHISYLFVLVLFFIACSSGKETRKNAPVAQADDKDSINTEAPPGDEEYYEETFARNYDHVYRDNIKTARLYVEGYEQSYPYIELNSGQKLVLSFDDLHADYKTYSYAIVHCNADWKPSGLLPQQYMQGMGNELIDRYKFSFNTLQAYTHYETSFPNDYISFKKTGNYLLHVYLNYNDEALVLTKRFIVYDNKVSVTGKVVRPTIVKNMDYRQEVDFTVHHGGYPIENPYGDLKVVILKNHRWDNAITGLKPVYVKDRELIYDHQGKNEFDGGNEFRKINMKSYRMRTEEVRKIIEGDTINDVFLAADESRSYKQYLNIRDINGNYIIERQEGNNNAVEADYARVHFTLNYDTPLKNGNLYVFGRLTDWRFREEFKMVYNLEKTAYTTTAMLKQGYYNYAYAFLPDGSDAGELSRIEGMHYETENDYTILVYHRPTGEDHDLLIGIKHLNSVRD